MMRRHCSSLASRLQQQQFEKIARLPNNRPTALCTSRSLNPEGGRRLWQGVASPAECARAVAAAHKAMQLCCDTDGGDGRLFPPDVPEARRLLGPAGFGLVERLHQRLHRRVFDCYGAVHPVNYLISWISGRAEPVDDSQSFEFDSHAHWLDGTYALHVDKANQPEYDVSALLYLNGPPEFEGGRFAFNDPEQDVLVEPEPGLMLAFESGFDNLHQVRPVASGERFALCVWYSRTRKTRMEL